MANTTPSDSKSPAEEQLDQAQLIEETGSVRTPNAKHLIHCLNIIGQVEGHNVLPLSDGDRADRGACRSPRFPEGDAV